MFKQNVRVPSYKLQGTERRFSDGVLVTCSWAYISKLVILSLGLALLTQAYISVSSGVKELLNAPFISKIPGVTQAVHITMRGIS